MKPKHLLAFTILAALTTLSLVHAQGAYTPESPTIGATTLVSVASDGTQGNWTSGDDGVGISAYGPLTIPTARREVTSP